MKKNLFNKKRGMTLGEMCMVFIIIGVIASIAVVTVKPMQKSMKYLYYKAYHFIKTGIYNATINKPIFPQTSTELCNAFLEFINANENHCEASRNLTNNPSNGDFTEDKVQIITSNGVRLYIAADTDGKPFRHDEVQTNGITSAMDYYIVYADLNGNMGPNQISTGSTALADIVAFVVTETADVVPVGNPEIDTRYMFAKAVYSPTDMDDEYSHISEPVSYYEAKHLAFGNNIDEREVMSLHFQDDFPNGSPIKITYPDAANTPVVNTTEGCTEVNSVCYVKIEEFF